ncbi:MAG TPA: HYR domain-containing protein [Planctomycetota bacterium]
MTLEGLVVDGVGAPVAGAVVVSNAGGRAVTDAAGRYDLELQVAPATTSLQVTAASAQGSVSQLTALGPTGRVNVGVLTLQRPFCSPGWAPIFGALPGTDGVINAMVVHDDGSGPTLFAAGFISLAGGVPLDGPVAKWDGSSWSSLGGGLTGQVHALAVFDDGGGPALYAGGSLGIGGQTANGIARWDGSSWSTLGAGVGSGTVRALVVHDVNGTPNLIVGGSFSAMTGGPSRNVARWDGTTWGAMSGPNGTVHALAVFNDGSGPALYVGGDFTVAGTTTTRGVARWTPGTFGGTYQALGGGLITGRVYALAVHDEGSGPALYAGGDLVAAGASNIARWNGTSWSAVGSGLPDDVHALAVHDDGGGARLIAGGIFQPSRIASWDGSSWTEVGGGISAQVKSLAVFDAGTGPTLVAGGGFERANGRIVRNVTRLEGGGWAPMGPDPGLTGQVTALATFDDGSGTALYAAGGFRSIGSLAADRIARWDGASWQALGSGLNSLVETLVVHDDGTGPALYAGGAFILAGGALANRIARWDGASWTPLGAGMNSPVWALAEHDDGSGLALYAGGGFTSAGGAGANRIARWNGASWSALGSGLDGGVLALAVHDDGTGPALYAGGDFDVAGGSPAKSIARWNGAGWTSLGDGLHGSVSALAVFDDGSGPALFAGGFFTSAGTTLDARIARWDGVSWSEFDAVVGFSEVSVLAVHDDGQETALYAGGYFTSLSCTPASMIARWNGTVCSPLGGGLNDRVLALATFDDGNGPALFVGGSFEHAFDSRDAFLAKWGQDLAPPTIDAPAEVVVVDRLGTPGEVVHFVVSAVDALDPAPSLQCLPPSGSHFPPGTTLVTCTATDDCGNQSTTQFPVTVVPKARRR